MVHGKVLAALAVATVSALAQQIINRADTGTGTLLEQCGRSIMVQEQEVVYLQDNGSGEEYNRPVKYDPVCNGFEYQLTLYTVPDGVESAFSRGFFSTFSVDQDQGSFADYDFLTTYFRMNDAINNSPLPFTFGGEVRDGQGNTFTITTESQVKFFLVTEYANPDAADCESGAYFPDMATDENFNPVVTNYQVSQYNTSSFSFVLRAYVHGVCRPEMYTDFFLSSDAGDNIPCSRLNYPTRPQNYQGYVTGTCQIAWNALSTTALYTIDRPDAPAGRPNSGAVPLAPPVKPTFRVSQPGASVSACVQSFVYSEPRFTYSFKSDESGNAVDPTNFVYTIQYDGALCDGFPLSGLLSRPAGGSNVPGSSVVLTNSGSVDFVFDISVADMDNQMTEPKRPYEFNGNVLVNVDGTTFSAEAVGPSFVFKYIEFPNVARCADTITFPELSTSRYQVGSVDFLSTDTDNFVTRIAYTNNGYCERGQFIDLRLTNTDGTAYNCARHIPDIEFSGGGDITCERVKGTMSTLVVWKLEDANPDPNFGKRRVGGVVYAGSQQFRVTHSDDAQATGGLRRRQRQVQAGLEVPSDIQCLPGLEICPVPGRLGSWECLDTTSMLDACGGCPQSGGKDCTEIAGISTVACEAGICIVKECDEDHALTKDASGCVPLTNSIRWSAI